MIYPAPRLRPFGDAALSVVFGDEISPEAHERVRSLDAALSAHPLPGVRETLPAYCSLLVEYDPLQLSYAALAGHVSALSGVTGAVEVVPPRLHRIPTLYGGDAGPDLTEVAALHGLTPEDVIRIHSAAEYTVYMLGFSPGFAYMGLVPGTIATPRLSTPRTSVPAGSVGIAGRQTGIYPQSTPGGWRLLGRTDQVLFDPRREPPALFHPGDRVRFVAVAALDQKPLPVAAAEPRAALDQPDAAAGAIEILAGGVLATVQDPGRFGHQRYGVPAAGAVDPFTHAAANALVGNQAHAATLEITAGGTALRLRQDMLIAVAGADLGCRLHSVDLPDWDLPLWTACFVRGGSWLEFRGRRAGCRAYLAFAGGVQVPPVMGSRSTYLAGGFGGHHGRALREGDRLDALPLRVPAGRAGNTLPHEERPAYGEDLRVRVVPGPHEEAFAPSALRVLLSGTYRITPASDRMGLRLAGPRLEQQNQAEMISTGMALGAVQVPSDGQPIVLMADRQTAGGYPVIATVVRADIPVLAQCFPGQSLLHFEVIDVAEAQAVYRQQALGWRPDDFASELMDWMQ